MSGSSLALMLVLAVVVLGLLIMGLRRYRRHAKLLRQWENLVKEAEVARKHYMVAKANYQGKRKQRQRLNTLKQRADDTYTKAEAFAKAHNIQ